MTKIMEYKIVEEGNRDSLGETVNALIFKGWRPYGIPFYIDKDDSGFRSWNQTMVRLSVKDKEEADEDWTAISQADLDIQDRIRNKELRNEF